MHVDACVAGLLTVDLHTLDVAVLVFVAVGAEGYNRFAGDFARIDRFFLIRVVVLGIKLGTAVASEIAAHAARTEDYLALLAGFAAGPKESSRHAAGPIQIVHMAVRTSAFLVLRQASGSQCTAICIFGALLICLKKKRKLCMIALQIDLVPTDNLPKSATHLPRCSTKFALH